jgi:hypothetical protein
MDINNAVLVAIVAAAVVYVIIRSTRIRVNVVKKTAGKPGDTYSSITIGSTQDKTIPKVLVLLANHQDDEALREIRKALTLDDASAHKLLDELRPLANRTGDVHTSFESHRYRLPKDILDLVKQHRDEQALSEIKQTTGLNDPIAHDLLDELKEVVESPGKKAYSIRFEARPHFVKASQEVMRLVREGNRQEAIDKLISESKLSIEEAEAIVDQLQQLPPP